MEKKPQNDRKMRKRPATNLNGQKGVKRRKLHRTPEEIFAEIQEVIDNTPSCSTTDVEAMLSESIMWRYDEELSEALSMEETFITQDHDNECTGENKSADIEMSTDKNGNVGAISEQQQPSDVTVNGIEDALMD